MTDRVFKIAVYGSAGGDSVEQNEQSARIIGVRVALSGNILCTGACEGIPFESAVSADVNNGLVLGFSPAVNRKEHVEVYKLPITPHTLIFTGMGFKGRNLICTRTCDAGIFIAGRWGTMNEFTLMCDEGEGKVIGLLKGSGGFVDSKIIPGLEETDKPSKAKIVVGSDPEFLTKCVIKELQTKQEV